jgi:hypothetical protein
MPDFLVIILGISLGGFLTIIAPVHKIKSAIIESARMAALIEIVTPPNNNKSSSDKGKLSQPNKKA